LLTVTFMHVVCLSLASLVELVSLDEATVQRVIFLKLVVAWCLVVAKHWSDGKVFRACVKHYLSGLRDRRAHPHGSEIDSVISACQGHLELQVIPVINRAISAFT
jgi:hypothetical protein